MRRQQAVKSEFVVLAMPLWLQQADQDALSFGERPCEARLRRDCQYGFRQCPSRWLEWRLLVERQRRSRNLSRWDLLLAVR